MDETIDSLVIEIDSSASKATGGIDSLIEKLDNLQNVIQGNLNKMNSFISSLSKISELSANIKPVNLPLTTSTTTVSSVDAPSGNNSALISSQEQTKEALKDVNEEVNKTVSALDKLSNTKPAMSIDGIRNAVNELNSLENLLNKIQKNKLTVDTTPIKARIGELRNTLGTNIESGVKRGNTAFNKLNSTASSVFDKLSGKVTGVGKSMVKNFVSPTNLLFNTFKNGKKSLGDLGSAVESLTKKLKMTTLALLGARGAFTAIRKAVNAYMQYDNELSKSLQNNWAVLGSLLAPIIERLVSLFSTLVSYVAMFIKMLTGVDLVARANAKGLESYQKKAGASAKSTKALADELAGLQKFDDLNVADFGKDSGSSGGGSGTGFEPLTIEDIDITPLESFLEFLEGKDWYGIGMEIARKFNDGLRLIDFDWLEEKAREWGKNMADLFNGLTDGTDWNLVGEKIAGGLNTAMGFVNTFFDNYNFVNLGNALGTGLNAVVRDLKWDDVGKFLTNGIKGAINTLFGFVKKFEFGDLGKGIGEGINSAIKNIPWGNLGQTLVDGVFGVFDTLWKTIETMDWTEVGKSISDFIVNFFDELNDQFETHKEDINSIGDKLEDAFIDIVKNIDWKEIGKKVIEFLWNAILNQIENQNFFTKTKRRFEKGLELLPEVFGKAGEDSGKNLTTRASDAVEPLKNKIGSKFNSIKSDIEDKMGKARNFIEDNFKWDKIKNTFDNLGTKIGDKFTTIKDDIKKAMDKVKDKLTEVFDRDTYKKTLNKFNSLTSFFSTIGEYAGDEFKKKLTEGFKKVLGKIEDTLNDARSGINKVIKAVSAISGKKIDPIPEFKFPGLAVGTNEIEVEGLYHLHQGEAVVPKKYNPAVNNRAYDENNSKLMAKLDTFIDIVKNMETTNNFYVDSEKVYEKTEAKRRRQTQVYGTTIS